VRADPQAHTSAAAQLSQRPQIIAPVELRQAVWEALRAGRRRFGLFLWFGPAAIRLTLSKGIVAYIEDKDALPGAHFAFEIFSRDLSALFP
jgi:hypothetical protein